MVISNGSGFGILINGIGAPFFYEQKQGKGSQQVDFPDQRFFWIYPNHPGRHGPVAQRAGQQSCCINGIPGLCRVDGGDPVVAFIPIQLIGRPLLEVIQLHIGPGS